MPLLERRGIHRRLRDEAEEERVDEVAQLAHEVRTEPRAPAVDAHHAPSTALPTVAPHSHVPIAAPSTDDALPLRKLKPKP